ncbi:MipA/OmpV family protein [Janthinobacterium agaricidamnosum]|uniref:MltA-interacting MipA family protein n=1 Tax=Janthinobacterium agaricidamnosum NBRC 102515 = DSM 9628 TaxID=1349767 RepID=W0VDE9_9BURK|nr:MipA/OmpV family protein [Janthinobacterium agaricidamnosum]CDG85926.1 mltA-interacting MipA family protein [Janthinobacterium agaricidamnosum NBRC 102515 = DSM 9628]
MSHTALFSDRLSVVAQAGRRLPFLIGATRRPGMLCAALAALLGCLPAAAQEAPASASASVAQWGLGFSAGSLRKPYKGVANQTVGVPIVLYENRWLSAAGPLVDLKLPVTGPVSFRLRARYEPGAGYDAGDSAALSGMEHRKTGLWLGGAVLWRSAIADVGAEWLADASGYSKGQRATFSVQRRFPMGNFSVTPRLEASWLDHKNASYYYGVRTGEAVAGRPFYEAGSTVNTRLGVRLDYRIMPRHAVFFDVSATRLGSEIKDSPIVDRASASSAFVGYTYLF